MDVDGAVSHMTALEAMQGSSSITDIKIGYHYKAPVLALAVDALDLAKLLRVRLVITWKMAFSSWSGKELTLRTKRVREGFSPGCGREVSSKDSYDLGR